MRFAILAIILLTASAAALAQEQPIVRAEITPEVVAVGEAAELKVTVLVPTWFTRPSIYPNLELANAITRLPDDSSYPIRENVGKDSWSGIVRSYEILPLFGASYRLSGQSISISYANPGSEPVVVDVEIPEVVFRGSVPAGATELEPYIAGKSLKLSLSVDGSVDDLEVGDALVLTYSAELEGLPAIFIPPLLPDLSSDGVSVYADAPDLEDGMPARRSEKLTLVFDAGGEFVVPGLTLSFWNSDTESIDSATVEGLSIEVSGPVVAPPSAGGEVEQRWTLWAWVAAGLSIVACVIYAFGSAVAKRYRAAVEERKRSEPYAFAALQSALRANNAKGAYQAMLNWLKRLDPGITVRQLAQEYGDEKLLVAVDGLSKMIYAGVENEIDVSGLAKGLGSARGKFLSQMAMADQNTLPPLNP